MVKEADFISFEFSDKQAFQNAITDFIDLFQVLNCHLSITGGKYPWEMTVSFLGRGMKTPILNRAAVVSEYFNCGIHWATYADPNTQLEEGSFPG